MIASLFRSVPHKTQDLNISEVFVPASSTLQMVSTFIEPHSELEATEINAIPASSYASFLSKDAKARKPSPSAFKNLAHHHNIPAPSPTDVLNVPRSRSCRDVHKHMQFAVSTHSSERRA